jgi:hypothetical protein
MYHNLWLYIKTRPNRSLSNQGSCPGLTPALSHFVGEGVRSDAVRLYNEVIESRFPTIHHSYTPAFQFFLLSLRALQSAEKAALLELAHYLVIDLVVNGQRSHRRFGFIQE